MPNCEETLFTFGQIHLDSMTQSFQSQDPQWENTISRTQVEPGVGGARL